MNLFKRLLPVIGIVITALLIIANKSLPAGQLWQDYTVMYVKNDVDTQLIQSNLQDNSINDFICLNNQRIPIMLNPNSIEAAMLKINIQSEQNQYLFDRQNYFFDSTGNYNLFYIPQEYKKTLNEIVQNLKKQDINCGIDSNLSYLWLLPVIIFALALILFCFSKNKGFYFITSILPVVYILCNAYYAAAIADIILLLCLFFVSNVYKRTGAIKKILSNYVIIAALVISCFIAFSVSIQSGFSYLILLAGCVISIYLCITSFKIKFSKYEFQPVFIRPAKMISIFGGKAKKIMPFTIICSIAVIFYFILTSSGSFSFNNDKNILLPANAEVKSQNLPDLQDFYRWNWNVMTYSKKSINVVHDENSNEIHFPRFSKENGIIKQIDEIYTFDDDFKSNVNNNIDFLDFNSIEKVLKIQGEEFVAGYKNFNSYKVSIFSIIMMIIGFFMLLFIYFSAIIRKGGKK